MERHAAVGSPTLIQVSGERVVFADVADHAGVHRSCDFLVAGVRQPCDHSSVVLSVNGGAFLLRIVAASYPSNLLPHLALVIRDASVGLAARRTS